MVMGFYPLVPQAASGEVVSVSLSHSCSSQIMTKGSNCLLLLALQSRILAQAHDAGYMLFHRF